MRTYHSGGMGLTLRRVIALSVYCSVIGIDAYFKGMEWGSFRIEDCYLITKEGAKRMTTYNDRAIPELYKRG